MLRSQAPDEDSGGAPPFHREVLPGDPEARQARAFQPSFVAGPTKSEDEGDGHPTLVVAVGTLVADMLVYGGASEATYMGDLGVVLIPGVSAAGKVGEFDLDGSKPLSRPAHPGATWVERVGSVGVVRVPDGFPEEAAVAWARLLLENILPKRVVVLCSASSPFVHLDVVRRLSTRKFASSETASELNATAPPVKLPLLLQGPAAALLSACEGRQISACALVVVTPQQSPSVLSADATEDLDASLRTAAGSLDLLRCKQKLASKSGPPGGLFA